MNDTERELRELFEQKASEARVTPLAPPTVLQRARRRQLATAIIGGCTTIALILGAIVGAQGLLRGGEMESQPGNAQPVTTRSVLLYGLTVTSPSNWTLVDEWPLALQSVTATCSNQAGICTHPETNATLDSVPGQLPVLQLSNFDPGLQQIFCGDGRMPSDGAALYIGNDWVLNAPQRIGDISGDTLDLSTDPMTGPCGTGYYALVGSTGFFAFVALGPDASAAERQQVLDTFNGLSPVATGPSYPLATTPGYVLAGGSASDGSPWRIEVRPSEERSSPLPLQMTIVLDDGKGTEFLTFGEPTADQIPNSRNHGIWWGVVPADTTSLEFQPSDGGDSIPAELFEIPLSLSVRALGFAVQVPDNVDGQLMGSTPTSGFAIGTAVAVAPSPVSEPPTGNTTGGQANTVNNGVPLASGNGIGAGWVATWEPEAGKIRFSLLPTAASANNFSVTVTPGRHVDYAETLAPEGTFLVVAAPADVGSISVRLADGTVIQGHSYPGLKEIGKSVILWVIPLTGLGRGTLESSSQGTLTTVQWPPLTYGGG